MGGKALTERQRKILEVFRSMTGANGRPPSVRDIARHFRIQVSAVWRHLDTLRKKGWLSARNGFFSLPGSASVSVPILARVPAGSPREAIEAPEGWLPFRASEARGRELFAVRVRGDSMTGAAILDDDLLVCERVQTAREGEIVVALLDGDATVKRLGRHSGAPALLPANPAYKPILLRGEVRIAGRVMGVFRTLKERG